MKAITRIRIDLAAINFSFLLNFSAYYSMQGLQSSLNKSIGTESLCALFVSLTVSALFVPPFFMSTIGERRSMAIGTLTYSLFTLANCYPRSYTLIPAAIIMGCGAAILWVSVRGYIRDLSVKYSAEDGSDTDATTTHFFGVLMAFLSASLLIGNVTSSTLFQSITPTENDTVSSRMASYTTDDTPRNASSIPKLDISHCGMHNCDHAEQNRTESAETTEQIIINSPVPYILFGVFASLQAIAAAIQLFVLTDPSGGSGEQSNKGSRAAMIDKGEASKHTIKHTIAKQLVATMKLNVFSSVARLLILITAGIGIVEGFVMGQLTRDWMTCYMGIQYVGYGICVFGIGSIAASYGCGVLAYRISRQTMLLVVLVLELAAGCCLLLWEPNAETDSWLFYVTFTAYGVIYTSRKTLINASYTIFFPDDGEAANSSATMWAATGAALAFAISSKICNQTFVILMLVWAVVGTAMFVVAEKIRKRSQEKNPGEVQADEEEQHL